MASAKVLSTDPEHGLALRRQRRGAAAERKDSGGRPCVGAVADERPTLRGDGQTDVGAVGPHRHVRTSAIMAMDSRGDNLLRSFRLHPGCGRHGASCRHRGTAFRFSQVSSATSGSMCSGRAERPCGCSAASVDCERAGQRPCGSACQPTFPSSSTLKQGHLSNHRFSPIRGPKPCLRSPAEARSTSPTTEACGACPVAGPEGGDTRLCDRRLCRVCTIGRPDDTAKLSLCENVVALR